MVLRKAKCGAFRCSVVAVLAILSTVQAGRADSELRTNPTVTVRELHTEPTQTALPSPLSYPTTSAGMQNQDEQASPSPSPDGRETTIFDSVHGSLSHAVLTSATWLDSFFGDERFDAESNQSRVRARYEAFRETGEQAVFRPNVDLRLALPQLKKKTFLVISGDPNEDIEQSSSPAAVPSNRFPAAQDRNVTTALQYFFRSTERRSSSIMAGAKLHGGDLVYLIGPRYRYFYPYEIWAFRFIQEAIWYSDTDWKLRTRFDFERPFHGDMFFRTSAEGVWTEDVDGYAYSFSFLVRQPIDDRRAVEYVWSNSFETRPVHVLEEVLFIFRYRQKIWRDWLFFEIAPQERFPRERSFRETPGIMFKIEMMFGDYKGIFF